MSEPAGPYVSRGGLKLEAALRAFEISVRDCIVADFGSHAGGFVDCLLQHGAAKVYAVEPGYGVLAYKLRRDPRVVVCERKNALYMRCPESCDWVTIDVGWTKQEKILPAAAAWLKPAGRVITLIKPHYEAPREWLIEGVLPADKLPTVRDAVRSTVERLGWEIQNTCDSPIRGHGGNEEWLWLMQM